MLAAERSVRGLLLADRHSYQFSLKGSLEEPNYSRICTVRRSCCGPRFSEADIRTCPRIHAYMVHSVGRTCATEL